MNPPDPSDDAERPGAPLRIRDLPPSDRPRERLRDLGARALTTRELVAILIGSGGRGASALQLADRVVSRLGPAAEPGGTSSLADLPGLGPASVARLEAAFELGRRAAARPLERGTRISGPADVYRLLGPRMRDLDQEEFRVLLLDTRHRVLGERMITRGTIDASLVHPREIFRAAITEGAAALILVHNHPSGDPTPSAEDRAVTRQLSEAGRVLGVPVLDHVVLGDGRWVSLAEGTG